MKDVKTAASRSYREYLISSLKDPQRAAGYIGVMLELDEDGYDPKIIRSALEEVVEARKQLGTFSETAQQHYEKLDKILAETGGNEILALIEFLDVLGYRISIVPKD
ncbi:MAG: transcriptional regulator [Nostocaceae cyanobacterium]|nr:transcriptional regulator [Nostocaceae cyanobacterium]